MATISITDLKPNTFLRGPIFPEPIQVLAVIPMGTSVKLIGKGLRTGQVHEPILSPDQIATLEITPETEPFDGDAARFRLGVEAARLGLAYEYDPYFSLSIARVDPLPHQLEAVYDYFLKLPRNLWPIGERLEPRFGKLGREFKHIVFDKQLLTDDPTLEWVTPGHPLFEVVREEVTERVQFDLQHGAVFYDLQRAQPARLDVFSAAIRDGRGNVLHRRLFVVEAQRDGALTVRQPTLFLDLLPAPSGTATPDGLALPDRTQVERTLIEQALQPFLSEISTRRKSRRSHGTWRSV